MQIYIHNTCMYIYICMHLTPIIHKKLNDLSPDKTFIVDSEIQIDLEAMSIKCIVCKGEAQGSATTRLISHSFNFCF